MINIPILFLWKANRVSLYKKVCKINVTEFCLLFAFVRNRWSSGWIYTILTQTVSCARQRANMWTQENLWWHPVNCTGGGIMQQQTKNTKVLPLIVRATFRAANHCCIRLWLVHVALLPERQSVRLKLQLQGAMNLKRMMRMNCETSLFDNRPFWLYYCKYLPLWDFDVFS